MQIITLGNATDFAFTSNTVSGTIKTIEPSGDASKGAYAEIARVYLASFTGTYTADYTTFKITSISVGYKSIDLTTGEDSSGNTVAESIMDVF